MNKEQKNKEIKEKLDKPSLLWYLVPFLFTFIGSTIAYFLLRKRDEKMAFTIFFIGLIFWFIIICSLTVHNL
jgi:fucose 4-O-acetylase-like acetyltransferase